VSGPEYESPDPSPVEPSTTSEPTVEPPAPRGPSFGTVVTGLILVALGVVWLLSTIDAIDVDLALSVPVALAVVGLALILGSFRGSHPGLVTLGVFLTVATLVVSFFPAGFRGGIGEQNITVTQIEQLEERYDIAIGKIEFDMRNLQITNSVTVELTVGAGEIRVRTPQDVALRVDASVGAGEVQVRGERSEGLLPGLDYKSPGFDTASVTLTLKINVGAGKIEVD
jgi:predicted membrane protein